jgi:DNA-binding NtrC family response regulator
LIITRSKTISAKILIVDDEKSIVEEVLETLTAEGYQCFGASGVDAAVELVSTEIGIDLIVTDLRMPKKTGADLIKTIETKWGQQIKFIVMSGHASPGIEYSGIDIASYPFLKKPVDVDALIDTVACVLEARG